MVVVMASSLVLGQVAGATLSGSITDPSGLVVTGAQVSVANIATGVVRTVASDSAGFYIAPNLVPGQYRVKVDAKGFATSTADVILTVGSTQTLDFHIKIGGTT